MKTITKVELDTLCRNGKAIDEKSGYPAVVLHPNGTITKFWARKKSLFSSATFRPYSARFVKNAALLKARGVVVPEIVDHLKLENSHVRLVSYLGLSGISIRELIHSAPQQIDLPSLCGYMHSLHNKGILFEGMHLGNIIQMTDGYGLIDFTDVRFFKSSLSPRQRAINLRTPIRYQEDIDALAKANQPDFIETYLKVADLNEVSAQEIRNYLSP